MTTYQKITPPELLSLEETAELNDWHDRVTYSGPPSIGKELLILKNLCLVCRLPLNGEVDGVHEGECDQIDQRNRDFAEERA
jgi:hypothetical protein